MIGDILRLVGIGFIFGMALVVATFGLFGIIDYLGSMFSEWPEEDDE